MEQTITFKDGAMKQMLNTSVTLFEIITNEGMLLLVPLDELTEEERREVYNNDSFQAIKQINLYSRRCSNGLVFHKDCGSIYCCLLYLPYNYIPENYRNTYILEINDEFLASFKRLDVIAAANILSSVL